MRRRSQWLLLLLAGAALWLALDGRETRSTRTKRPTLAEAPATASPARGRLVDEATLEPIPEALVVVRGRVQDELGRPWSEISVWAAQVSEGRVERLETKTGADGSYQLNASEPGRMQVVLASMNETATRTLKVAAQRGLTQAPDVVFQRRESVSIRGWLRSRSGRREVEAHVRLRALDGSGYEEVSWFRGETFAFDRVPAGRFELAATSAEGHRWSPAALEISAPGEGLVLTCEDAVALRFYRFDLVDADSDVELGEASVSVRTESGYHRRIAMRDEFRLAEGTRFEWRASLPGYRPSSGTELDFETRGAVSIARIGMRRGFSARLVLKDWTEALVSSKPREVTPTPIPVQGRGSRRVSVNHGTVWPSEVVRVGPGRLAGAAILADGVQVATSDALGVAELDLPAAPQRIDVVLPGWRVLSPQLQDGQPAGSIETDVFLIRE